jgi:hypothetical protein
LVSYLVICFIPLFLTNFFLDLELKKLKWDTNGAIRINQRDSVYFVDPLPLSDPLLNKIREGDFVAMHGSRASGKSTRVFNVIEQLEKEGYLGI